MAHIIDKINKKVYFMIMELGKLLDSICKYLQSPNRNVQYSN